jgi:hypothetical protein
LSTDRWHWMVHPQDEPNPPRQLAQSAFASFSSLASVKTELAFLGTFPVKPEGLFRT